MEAPVTAASLASEKCGGDYVYTKKPAGNRSAYGAGDEARTRYLHLGKVALYQMSYTRGNRNNYSGFHRFVKGQIP